MTIFLIYKEEALKRVSTYSSHVIPSAKRIEKGLIVGVDSLEAKMNRLILAYENTKSLLPNSLFALISMLSKLCGEKHSLIRV